MTFKHGYKTGTKTYPEYAVWSSIIQRCCNPNHKAYNSYGGRGINICKKWRENFINFLNDMGNRPSTNYTIERIDNNKGYEKDNCRWASWSDQNINKRTNVWVIHDGEKMLLLNYAKKIGISFQAAHKRVQRARASNKSILKDGTVVRRED